jgi:hypothetical protein
VTVPAGDVAGMGRMRWTPFAVGLAMSISGSAAAAQYTAVQPEFARAQIQATLRSFYFNLSRHDWEALTADILAAKVVAHRHVPEALMVAAVASGRTVESSAAEPVTCSAKAALVGQAAITLDGDWAEVSVPRCTGVPAGADEFRLIHFEARWRFVSIDLFQEPANVSAGLPE